MEQYLCIAATFLTDHYHGREWPPDPARLFQALIAGAHTGAYRQHWPQVEPVLRTLECQPAPEMVARSPLVASSYSIAVPNNDSDKAGREWVAGREFDPGKLRTMKTVSPRGFHATSEAGAHVYYVWPLSESLSAHTVRQLTSFLHTFGWGVDMAYADSFVLSDADKRSLTNKQGYSHYKPAEKGHLHNVPAPGYLDDLKSAYTQSAKRQTTEGVNPSIRATSYGQQRYATSGAVETPIARFSLRKLEDLEAPYRVPWALGMRVAAWMRHAAAEALRQEKYLDDFINGYVLGHGNGHGRHMSFVPVPNVGFRHADGAIRRVMVLEPPGADGEITALLQLKLSSAVLHRLLENGNGPRKTESVCQLFEAQSDNIWPYYTGMGALWHSVTPVVLHGHNSEHGKFSLKKTEQLLYQAFEKSGYPRQSITGLVFQSAPLWPGTEGALAMRVPEHLKKWPRYHVAVRFSQPISGPVVVGIGRHYGVGLFASPGDKEAA
jgi:CRISPR-associated protein Csb2